MTLQSINWSEIMFKSLNLKEAMATSIGMQWWHGATILTKFKLLNIILDQLMDCYVSIVMYYACHAITNIPFGSMEIRFMVNL